MQTLVGFMDRTGQDIQILLHVSKNGTRQKRGEFSVNHALTCFILKLVKNVIVHIKIKN